MKNILLAVVLMITASFAFGQNLKSGGILKPEQAIYDVRHYSLALSVDINNKSIDGTAEIDIITNDTSSVLLFDLVHLLVVRKVWVNGKEAGHIIWRPYELDLTEYVRQGENTIGIELVNSLHNVLGPHHDVRGEVVPFVGPDSFEDPDNWVDTYYFRPFGIKGVNLLIEKEIAE